MNLTTFIFIIILIFPIYFFSKKILVSCKIGSKGAQFSISILLGVFLSPILYGGIIGGKLMVEEYSQRVEFNQEVWINNVGERNKMSYHIIESDMLIGKTEEEIKTLLGMDFFKENSNHLVYRIGFVQKIFTREHFIMNIYFKNDKVNFVSQDIDVMYW